MAPCSIMNTASTPAISACANPPGASSSRSPRRSRFPAKSPCHESLYKGRPMTAPRILVVDDEADLRELLNITLVRMGLDVDCAATLGEARKLFASTDYALVLTDMRLPDGLGLELVREVAASEKNTPIAVVTAYGSADNAVVALKAGAFDYVSKPVVLEQLRIMVQSALRLSAPPASSAGAPA